MIKISSLLFLMVLTFQFYSQELKFENFGARAMTNIRFSITQSMSVFGEYQLGFGLSQIENDATDQQTKNRNQLIKVGLRIEL